MSLHSSLIHSEVHSDAATIYDHGVACFTESTSHCASSLIINIHQLYNELQEQHKHDKHALIELNERFHLLIDRVELLRSEQAKYIEQIGDFQLRFFSSNDVGAQWSEHYLHQQSNLATINDTKVDCEVDFELFQLQTSIYQQLVIFEKQQKSEWHIKLEHELKESASVLDTLRGSYTQLECEVGNLCTARDDMLKQHLTTAHVWCNATKQRKKLELSLRTLKSQIACYNKLRSYLVQNYEFVSESSVDIEQFWSLQLDKCVKNIRHDFELLYGTFHREMTTYYEMQMQELQTIVQQELHYQKTVVEEAAMGQQQLKLEYEEQLKELSYEKETENKLQKTYSQLESVLTSIQLQQKEQCEAQSKELHNAQESITTMSSNIEQIRRSIKTLEADIIIYRHLLNCAGIQEPIVIASQPVSMTEKFVVENQSTRKKSIGIKECAPNGKYISLINHSTSKDVDISRWILKRRVDSAPEFLYTIPEEIRLRPGRELIIHSKSDTGVVQSTKDIVSALTHDELVSDNVNSWGMGNTTKTILLNQNGEEEASHTQIITFGKRQ